MIPLSGIDIRRRALEVRKIGRPRNPLHASQLATLALMNEALSSLLKDTLLVFGALFPIVNPIGNTPIFLSLTRGLSDHGRAVLARMVAINGLILILTSILIGTRILAFFGISLPLFRWAAD